MEPFPTPASSQPATTAKLLPIGQLISSSFGFYTKQGRQIASIMVLPLAAALLFFVPALSFAANIAFAILMIVTQISLILVLQEGGRPWSELSRRAWKKFLPAFGVSLLTGFIVLGGGLLFFFPAIYLAVSFSLGLMIVVVENIGGLTAILKSREYVRGYWTSVLGRLLILLLLSIIISAVLSFSSWTDPGQTASPLSSFLSALSSILIVPFTTAYIFGIYRNLTSIKPLPSFQPTSKSRTWAIVLAVLGFIAVAAFFFLMFMLLATAIGNV